MKTAIALLLSVTLLAVIGCESPSGGGMSSDQGFKIVVPVFDKTVKQGETRTVTIDLNRGKYFKQDVKLDIKASKGISVEPVGAMVRASDAPGVSLRITVAADAALGEYKIYITGTPTTGEPTSIDFGVKVVKP
jgi:uncharacterized membrane protein